MRDPERIDEILNLISQAWRSHPDMRLGQLVVNLLDPKPNAIFYIEDDVLLERLHSLLSSGEWPTRQRGLNDDMPLH
jgi:hypothetical protein